MNVLLCRCAGVCSYEGHGGLCSIRLSEPLLKFRPRKDLIETLLVGMLCAKRLCLQGFLMSDMVLSLIISVK